MKLTSFPQLLLCAQMTFMCIHLVCSVRPMWPGAGLCALLHPALSGACAERKRSVEGLTVEGVLRG